MGGSLTRTLTVGYEEGTGRSLRTSTYIYLKFQRIFNERKFVTKVRHNSYKEFLLGIKRPRFKSPDPSSAFYYLGDLEQITSFTRPQFLHQQNENIHTGGPAHLNNHVLEMPFGLLWRPLEPVPVSFFCMVRLSFSAQPHLLKISPVLLVCRDTSS